MSNQLPFVLHVDDDDDIRAVALIALETVGGLTVEQFDSGGAALEGVKKLKPDLFLLDVMMPGMNGMETLERLRAMPQFSSTPAVFMTAKVQESDVRQLLACGALDVIAKPFDPMTLASEVVSIWQRATGGPENTE